MKPSQKYNEYLLQSGFYQDGAQQHALYLLDRLHDEIESLHLQSQHQLISIFHSLIKKKKFPIRGLYFWGGVGRGKTFLMDIFFGSLSIKQKKRVHFHQFMKSIHDGLARVKNQKDPLQEVALQYAEGVRVLCLDEFVVTDIGDAMLIGRLLEALFSLGIIVVATSNSPPEELYKDGLQRANFLPAIDLLVDHCHVSYLDGGQDYRLLGLKQTHLYQCPHDETSVGSIRQYLNSHLISAEFMGVLDINGRQIKFEYCAEDTIWFGFHELCKTSRSRLDYLEISQIFSTLVLTGIEQMGDQTNDVARRFISLIDVLYDHRVKLICTAEVPIDNLYRQGFLSFEFQRTVSRLHEMQSADYIGSSHRI